MESGLIRIRENDACGVLKIISGTCYTEKCREPSNDCGRAGNEVLTSYFVQLVGRYYFFQSCTGGYVVEVHIHVLLAYGGMLVGATYRTDVVVRISDCVYELDRFADCLSELID